MSVLFLFHQRQMDVDGLNLKRRANCAVCKTKLTQKHAIACRPKRCRSGSKGNKMEIEFFCLPSRVFFHVPFFFVSFFVFFFFVIHLITLHFFYYNEIIIISFCTLFLRCSLVVLLVFHFFTLGSSFIILFSLCSVCECAAQPVAIEFSISFGCAPMRPCNGSCARFTDTKEFFFMHIFTYIFFCYYYYVWWWWWKIITHASVNLIISPGKCYDNQIGRTPKQAIKSIPIAFKLWNILTHKCKCFCPVICATITTWDMRGSGNNFAAFLMHNKPMFPAHFWRRAIQMVFKLQFSVELCLVEKRGSRSSTTTLSLLQAPSGWIRAKHWHLGPKRTRLNELIFVIHLLECTYQKDYNQFGLSIWQEI